MFKVTLISKDKNLYVFNSYSADEVGAIEEAIKTVDLLGWTQYQYKLYKCEQIIPKGTTYECK